MKLVCDKPLSLALVEFPDVRELQRQQQIGGGIRDNRILAVPVRKEVDLLRYSSPAKARNTFNGVDNLKLIYVILAKFEAMVETVKECGTKPH